MSLWSLVNFGNVLFLIAAIAALSLRSPALKVGVIILSALVIKFRPGFDTENILFMASLFFALILNSVLPFRPRMNAVVAVIGGVALLNIGLIFL